MNTAGRFFKLLWQCSDGDGGLNAGGQGGDGVEIDELNGDHEQTGHDVNNNQCGEDVGKGLGDTNCWSRCWKNGNGDHSGESQSDEGDLPSWIQCCK